MRYIRNSIVAAALAISGSVSLAAAADHNLAIDIDYTFASKYLWRGFDVYDDHTASQPSINCDLFESGFGVNLWHSRANGSGFENIEELDYTLYYSNTLSAEEWYQTDFTLTWVYFDYIDSPTRPFDLQEGGLTVSFPHALPGGVVPSYNVARLWPARSESPDLHGIGGWVHVFGLAYDWALPTSWTHVSDQNLCLTADVVYNDGYAGAGVDHDWSHATFGAATSFALAKNLTFTPALSYQISMDDSVNEENEFWCTLSVTLSL